MGPHHHRRRSCRPGGTATVTYRPVEGPQFSARRLGTAPSIDGRGDDWPAMAPIVADQVLVGGSAVTLKGLWSLGWDDENLYLLVQVVDPELTTTNAAEPGAPVPRRRGHPPVRLIWRERRRQQPQPR